ncbi:MAG: hypothetical protein K0S70_5196 [Microbacterium sp.]|nr:hypothetical protein [Microbacterium sp.]
MGLDDKIKNAAEDLTGKAKEAWGKATASFPPLVVSPAIMAE